MPIPTRSASLREPRKPQTSNIARLATNTTTSTGNPTSSRSTKDSTHPPSNSSPAGGLSKDHGASNQARRPTQSMGTVFSKMASRDSAAAPSPSSEVQNTQSTSTPRPPSPKKTNMPPPPRPMRSASLRQHPGTGSGPPAAVRGHARHRSQMVPSRAKPIQPDSTPTAQKSRPQFSSYQQHYSPKKPTKPPTPTRGVDAEPSSLLIPTSWPDIAALQTELLQLSLFHSNSLQRHNDWKAESETCLHSKYDGVAGQYHSVLGDEKMRQSQLNAQALSGWLQNCRDHRGPHDFPEQIQVLSQVLQETSDLVTTGMSGRYNQVVETFELWFEQAELVRHDREYSGHGISFVDPLDQAWKEELHALHVKLELCQRQLQSLDILGLGEVECLEQSALTRVARSLAESIQLMIQEISAMRTLEAELIRSEREAVSQLVDGLASPRDMSSPRVGIWNNI